RAAGDAGDRSRDAVVAGLGVGVEDRRGGHASGVGGGGKYVAGEAAAGHAAAGRGERDGHAAHRVAARIHNRSLEPVGEGGVDGAVLAAAAIPANGGRCAHVVGEREAGGGGHAGDRGGHGVRAGLGVGGEGGGGGHTSRIGGRGIAHEAAACAG